MNKYKKMIIIRLFQFSVIMLIFGIISGVFLFAPFLVAIGMAAIYTNDVVKNKKKQDNIEIMIKEEEKNEKTTYQKEITPIKYSKDKVKIKKRIRN